MLATLALTAVVIGIALIGLCFNLIFRKKPFPETHVGHNKEMKKLSPEELDKYYNEAKKNKDR